ncbi:3628_t:CDS:1, partial [Gigaspora rosea]
MSLDRRKFSEKQFFRMHRSSNFWHRWKRIVLERFVLERSKITLITAACKTDGKIWWGYG